MGVWVGPSRPVATKRCQGRLQAFGQRGGGLTETCWGCASIYIKYGHVHLFVRKQHVGSASVAPQVKFGDAGGAARGISNPCGRNTYVFILLDQC